MCPMGSPYRVSEKHVQRLMMPVTCSSLYPSVAGLSCLEAQIQPSPGKPIPHASMLPSPGYWLQEKMHFTGQTWRWSPCSGITSIKFGLEPISVISMPTPLAKTSTPGPLLSPSAILERSKEREKHRGRCTRYLNNLS